MSNKRLLLHIGYPKTGTTTLQESFFSNLKQIDYIGKPYKASWKRNLHDVIFNDLNKDVEIKTQHKTLVWSEENFLKFQFYKDQMFIKKLLKIKQIFFNYEIKIMITVRKHQNILRSCFQQFSEELKSNKIFLKDLNYAYKISNLNETQKDFINMYDYFKLYQNLLKIFNKDQIIFLFFENLVNDENDFLKKIDEFFFLNYKIPISLKKKNITKYKFTMLHKTLRFFKYLKKIIKLKYLKNLLYINRYFYYLKVVYDYSVPKKLIINKNINENIEINFNEIYIENLKKFEYPIKRKFLENNYFPSDNNDR